MADKTTSVRKVLDRLQEQGLVDEPAVKRIAEHLSREQAAPATPWYIKALIGTGAWVAAGFFIAFLLSAKLISIRDDELLLFWGFAFIGGATVIRRLTRHVFHVQLALALSVAGHIMALGGISDFRARHLWKAVLAALLLCAALYPLYKDSIHRFLSTLAAVVLICAWLLAEGMHHGLHVLVFLEALGIGYLFTSRRVPAAMRPMAYALAVSLPVTLGLMLMPWMKVRTPWWPSSAILALALVWLYGRLAGGLDQLRREPMVVAICVTLLLGIVSTPGVLAAVWLLVLGYALGDRILLGVGFVFLPAFIVMYYYDLDVSLLAKSGILGATGAVLLGARWYLSTRPWAREVA